MATVKDIAKILASRHKLRSADADRFMQQMVEVINEGLLSDRVVKIKGFGTFKLQAVKDRASVNVNTGERVVIEGHDKVTFTPDSMMKEIINKPFAQFETVVIDDDSPLLKDGIATVIDEDEPNDDAVTVLTDEQPPTVDEQTPKVEEQPPTVDEQTPKVEEQPQIPVMPVMEPNNQDNPKTPSERENPARPSEPQVLKAENVTVLAENVTVVKENRENKGNEDNDGIALAVAEQTKEEKKSDNTEPDNTEPDNTEQNTDDDTETEEMEEKKFNYSALLTNIAIAIIFFALGYWAGNANLLTGMGTSVKPVQEDSVTVTPPADTKKSDSITAPAAPVVPKSQEPAASETQPAAPETQPAALAQQEKQEEKPLTQYNSDNRVKTGAYYIMGTETEVTVKEGQTLSSIAKSYLGQGMECYVEAYNGVKEVKPGQKVKIPKLKMKKIRK